MGGFTVDTVALEGLARQISDMVDELRSVTTPGEAPSDDQLGGRTLGQAVRTFEDHWRGGSQRMLDRLASVQALVAQAAMSYEQTDAGVGQAAGAPVGEATP